MTPALLTKACLEPISCNCSSHRRAINTHYTTHFGFANSHCCCKRAGQCTSNSAFSNAVALGVDKNFCSKKFSLVRVPWVDHGHPRRPRNRQSSKRQHESCRSTPSKPGDTRFAKLGCTCQVRTFWSTHAVSTLASAEGRKLSCWPLQSAMISEEQAACLAKVT